MGFLLSTMNQEWLSPANFQFFSDAVHENQRILYNGHKKVHAIKFQSVITPNGLIANLYGPVERKRTIVVCLMTQVCFVSFNNTHMAQITTFYVYMVIQHTHSDHS